MCFIRLFFSEVGRERYLNMLTCERRKLLILSAIVIVLLNWDVCLNWIELHSTLFSALSSVGALLSAIFSFRSIKQTLKLREEDRNNFAKELANAMDIAEATKQQAVALEKLTNVLEKQTEILEKRKLDVLVQRTMIKADPDNNSQLLINILLTIVNPTQQIIKINSISIDNDRSYKFVGAVYRGVTDSTIFPFGDIYSIQPKHPKYLCFVNPKTEPPIRGNIDPFSLIAFGSLELILNISFPNKNLSIYPIFTMEHTAVDPENPPKKVTFHTHSLRLGNTVNPQ